MILSDREIRELALRDEMILPLSIEGRIAGRISTGLSSYGYDATLDTNFKIPTEPTLQREILDPKALDLDLKFSSVRRDELIIEPNTFVLGRTYEYFKIPRNIIALCTGKSTYARCGLMINVTPLEPEWEGHVTLELSNQGNRPIKVYANEGICQFVFLKASSVCDVSYRDKNGKYQGQIDVTVSRM